MRISDWSSDVCSSGLGFQIDDRLVGQGQLVLVDRLTQFGFEGKLSACGGRIGGMIDLHAPALALGAGYGKFGIADQFFAADNVTVRGGDSDGGANREFPAVDPEGERPRILNALDRKGVG